MNTFLPYYDFNLVAKCLDDKRLFKQVIEAKQIIDILTTGKTKSGKDYPLSMVHHPIVFAWKNNINALITYHDFLLNEVFKRGKIKTNMEIIGCQLIASLPKWLTNEVCEMYQAHLNRKNPDFYKFDVDPTIPFDWSLIK